ncbi:MAG: GNAT family protein [Chloroflexota bacterium]|nr:GNAT family protein [Chloroflexota bacterium]
MIYGNRVRLRAVEKDDLPRFADWLNDPEVRQGLTVFLPLSQTDVEKWFEKMLERPQEERPLVIEIEAEDAWVPVGNCGLFGLDWRLRTAEVGIFIGAKKYWNQGYGTDVVRLILRHGFNTLNLNRVFLRVHADNPRAMRAYEKAGFVHEGRMRQARFYAGEYVDVLLMSVLRSEWQDGTI